MNLEDISDIYKRNLIDFFSNEEIIKYIYEEQYGEENYNNNREEYHKEYRSIMENTIFIPYITLEHLENLINSAENKYGHKFVEEKLGKESELLRRLIIKKQEIVKDYTTKLIDEINQMIPNLTELKCDEILKKCSNIDFDDNIKVIQDTLEKNKKSMFLKLRRKQVNKCIERYKKDAKEKIIIETSSYFKHKRDIPNDKYYTSIASDMSKNSQFVSQQIGKDSERNYRYIYLPVLNYKTEKEYLKHAIHEVMHISKEKVSKNKYRSGLLERELSPNGSGQLLVKDNPLGNLLYSISWNRFKRNIKLPKKRDTYHSYLGDINFEEVVHHWQVRNVVNRIINDDLASLIHMPYKNENIRKFEYMNYECADKTTEKFMSSFGEDIQRVNSGEISIRKFKNYVGKTNFRLLGKLYETWTTGVSVKPTIVYPSKQLGGANIEFSFGPEQELYADMGNEIVENMVSTVVKDEERKTKRAQILAKTKDVLATDVCDIGKLLKEKLITRKNKSISGVNKTFSEDRDI